MKILMVSDDFLPAATGVGVHLQTVCEELSRMGHQVIILTSKLPGQQQVEQFHGATVIRCPAINIAGFWQAFPSVSSIKNLIQQHAVDIVHFHYWSLMAILVRREASRHGIPCVATYHMTADHLTQPWFMKPWRPLLIAAITKFSNHMQLVMIPCKKLLSLVTSQGVTTRCETLTNPLTRDIFYQDNLPAMDTQQHEGLNILYAGRLNAEKNLSLLIRAFALHLKSNPHSLLKIAGRGDQKRMLTSLAESLGVSDNVFFLGFLPHSELVYYYATCDVFVLPSIVETQGMVAMEAMRFKKPVIVTQEIISADDLVTHESNGYIVDAHDASDMASRLNSLAASSELRSQMDLAGYEKSATYDPVSVANTLVKHYADLLASSSKSASGILTERAEGALP